MDRETEEVMAREPWLPGDHIGRIWPSDELRNFSADGRAMGKRSAAVFRQALSPKADGADHV